MQFCPEIGQQLDLEAIRLHLNQELQQSGAMVGSITETHQLGTAVQYGDDVLGCKAQMIGVVCVVLPTLPAESKYVYIYIYIIPPMGPHHPIAHAFFGINAHR